MPLEQAPWEDSGTTASQAQNSPTVAVAPWETTADQSYVPSYVSGVSNAFKNLVSTQGALKDQVTAPLETAKTVVSGIAAPVLAMSQQVGEGILHPITGQPIENYSTIKDRYSYDTPNPIAQTNIQLVGAITKPVGDAINKAAGLITDDAEKKKIIADSIGTAIAATPVSGEGLLAKTDAQVVRDGLAKSAPEVAPAAEDTATVDTKASKYIKKAGGVAGAALGHGTGIPFAEVAGHWIGEKLVSPIAAAFKKPDTTATAPATPQDFTSPDSSWQKIISGTPPTVPSRPLETIDFPAQQPTTAPVASPAAQATPAQAANPAMAPRPSPAVVAPSAPTSGFTADRLLKAGIVEDRPGVILNPITKAPAADPGGMMTLTKDNSGIRTADEGTMIRPEDNDPDYMYLAGLLSPTSDPLGLSKAYGRFYRDR